MLISEKLSELKIKLEARNIFNRMNEYRDRGIILRNSTLLDYTRIVGFI